VREDGFEFDKSLMTTDREFARPTGHGPPSQVKSGKLPEPFPLVAAPAPGAMKKDVELADIRRLCREATATLIGHRMVVSKFRFVETVGAGGESNPCIDLIFYETIDAPASSPARQMLPRLSSSLRLSLHPRTNEEQFGV
jgi:hypothetical protein